MRTARNINEESSNVMWLLLSGALVVVGVMYAVAGIVKLLKSFLPTNRRC